MLEKSLDEEKLLSVLTRHEVRFVLIGGLAAILHGSPFVTEDIDITPEKSEANLDRLSAALKELHARIRVEDVPEGLTFDHSGESLAAAGVWNLVTDAGDFDISFMPNGTEGYKDLIRDATEEPIGDVIVPVASLADIIRSKQAANRPKDQRVLPTLREILSRRND